MALFIELVSDAYQDRIKSLVTTDRAGASNVRRPLRGIEIKDDTYAILKVILPTGDELELYDSGSKDGKTTSYTNFILQSVQEDFVEKQQIVDTFGEAYIFFFGQAPQVLACTAVLINSHDFNWKAEFIENYNTYLRGTKLVEMGARCYLFYDDNIVEGYMMNARIISESMTPNSAQLQFQFFVTSYQNISNIGSDKFPIRSSATIPDGLNLADEGVAEKLIRNSFAESQNQLYQQLATGIKNTDDPANKRRLTDLLRKGVRSAGFPGDVIERYLAGAVSATEKGLIGRTEPIRGSIWENTDEYTKRGEFDYREDDELLTSSKYNRLQNIQDLNACMDAMRDLYTTPEPGTQTSESLEGTGSPDAQAAEPYGLGDDIRDALGLLPTELPTGIPIGFGSGGGLSRTYGAVPFGSGAYAPSSGFSGFAGAYAGVGSGASAGAYASLGASVGVGSSVGAGGSAITPYQPSPGMKLRGYYGNGSRSSTSPYAYGVYDPTNPYGGYSNAFASGGSEYGSSSYAYKNARSSAIAGGDTGGGFRLTSGFSASGGASASYGYPGSGGNGASVYVGGSVSAFGIAVMTGTLKSTSIPSSRYRYAMNPVYQDYFYF